MTRTRIFIDTEFTDLIDFDLISIALVSGEDSYYGERCDFDRSLCETFTCEQVLPQLGRVTQKTKEIIAQEVREWLWQYKDLDPVLSFDNVIDFGLLRELLGEVPDWLHTQNIKDCLDREVWTAYFVDNKVTPHHALHDSRANQTAYQSWLARQ